MIAPFIVRSQAVIDISNPTNIKRSEEVVSIAWKEILSAYPGIDSSYFIVFNAVTKEAVPYLSLIHI